LERSDKLDHLVSQISTAQFADPFPTEYATRDQVEKLTSEVALLTDHIDAQRHAISNLRACLTGILKDRFDAIDARLAALEAK